MSRIHFPILRLICSAVVGFIIAASIARLVIGAFLPKASDVTSKSLAVEKQPTVHPIDVPLADVQVPEPGTLAGLSRADNFHLSAQLAAAMANDPTRREILLAEAKQRPEPERSDLLFAMLTGWASVDPQAAAEWAFVELADLGNGPRRMALLTISETWAARDAMGLARWLNDKNLSKHKDLLFIEDEMTESFRRHDPLALAAFQEMPVCYSAHFGGPGDDVPQRLLDSPAFIQQMSTAVQGHVSYTTENFQAQLDVQSSTRHAKGKDVWNMLFEQTAVAWHRTDAAACEAWMQTFPETAQTAAKYFIAKDVRDRAPKSAPAEPSPPPVPALPPAQRLTIHPPAPGPAEDTARGDWSEWWRQDPAAAETFLNTATWSADLKFRARAKAYSSKP
jgi:hypothetical protein